MFQIPVASVVCMLKDMASQDKEYWKQHSFENGILTQNGIHVVLDLSVSDYTDEGEHLTCRQTVHFLLCGYTSVFVTVDNSWPVHTIPVEKFENISNHDSCWRDAIERFLSKLYFEWCAKVNPNKAPRDLHNFCWSLLRKPMEKVSISSKTKKDDSYHKDLVSVHNI